MRAHCVLQYIYGDGQTPPRDFSFSRFRVSVGFYAASNRMGAAVLGISGNSKEKTIIGASAPGEKLGPGSSAAGGLRSSVVPKLTLLCPLDASVSKVTQNFPGGVVSRRAGEAATWVTSRSAEIETCNRASIVSVPQHRAR
jgi:hypothetical protein